MSLIIQCTNGHRMTVAEEYRGKRVRCPQCQEILTVPAASNDPAPAPPPPAPTPRPQEDYGRHVQAPPAPVPTGDGGRRAAEERPDWDEPRDRRERWDEREERRDRDYERDSRRPDPDGPLDRDEVQQLKTVSLGLGFSFYRYLLSIFILVLVAVLFILIFINESTRFRGGFRRNEVIEVLSIVTVITMGLMGLLAMIFTFVGSGLCCRAPTRAGGAGLPMVSVILDGLGFLITIIMTVILLLARRADDVGPIAAIGNIFAGLLFLTAQALLSAFWYRLGNFLHDGGAARLAIGSMIAWLVGQVLCAILIVVFAIISANTRGDPTFPVLILVGIGIWIVMSIVLLALFLVVISKLKARIRSEVQGAYR